MFPSSNVPPPPSYDTATNYSLGNQYNTQFSDPSRTNKVQPKQSHPFGQPQGFNQPPYSLQQQPAPLPMGATNSPPYPVGNQQNITNLSGQEQMFTETKRQELQREAVIAFVCFFPLGIWAWNEYQRTVQAYSRGNVQEGKQQQQKTHKISQAAMGVGVVIIILIVLFVYIDILGWRGNTDYRKYDEP